MKKQLAPGALLSPVPAVLVSCGTVENPNVLTIAWAGTVCTHPPMVSISVRPGRFSYPIIKETGEFVINLPSVSMAHTVDFCGVKSGKDIDKFAQCNLTPISAPLVSAPAIKECLVSFSCKVKSITPLGTHDLFLAEIVGIEVDESLIEENGRLALERADLLAYAHGEYFSLGRKVGSFGFSVRKKPIEKPAKQNPKETESSHKTEKKSYKGSKYKSAKHSKKKFSKKNSAKRPGKLKSGHSEGK